MELHAGYLLLGTDAKVTVTPSSKPFPYPPHIGHGVKDLTDEEVDRLLASPPDNRQVK